MSRRRITSMPVGMVIVALLVIALVALIAVFLTGGASSHVAEPTPASPITDQPVSATE